MARPRRRRSRYPAVSPNAEPASDLAVRTAARRSARVDRAHALAAATGDGFHDERISDAFGGRADLRIGGGVLERASVPGHLNTLPQSRPAARQSCLHERNCLRSRADERQARVRTPARNLRSRQEPVARMHHRGARFLRDVNDAIDAQVAFARRARADRVGLVSRSDVQGLPVALGIHGDGAPAQLPARTDDAHGDLAAVGDEDFRGGSLLRHSGMLPCFFGGLRSRLFSQLASAAMSLVRVIRG